MKATPPSRLGLLSRILLLPLLVLFCFPGGAVLAELTRRRSTMPFSLTVELVVAVLCAIVLAYCLVSRWTPLRCVGGGLALLGYTAVANVMVPGQAIARQLSWLGVGGLVGAVAGAWLAPRPRSEPAGRAGVEPGAGGPAREKDPPCRPPVRVQRLALLAAAVACVLLVLALRDRNRVAVQARVAEAVVRCQGIAVFDDHTTPLVVFERLARHLSPDAGQREWARLSGVELGPLTSDSELEELLALGLNDLPDLSRVSLRDSQVTDAGLVAMEPMLRLERLSLGPATTDAGLVHLQRLVHLQTLDLSGTRITGEGLRLSKDLPDLFTLNLSRTGVTDDDLACLKEFPSLCRLYLCQTAITDAGLAHVEDLVELRFLALIGTRVSDAGLVHLAKLPKLRWLFLEETAVTEAGRRNLVRSRPEMRVYPLTSLEPPVARTPPAEPRR